MKGKSNIFRNLTDSYELLPLVFSGRLIELKDKRRQEVKSRDRTGNVKQS